MNEFFSSDVPEFYRTVVVDRFLSDLSKKDVSALRADFDHYDFLMRYSVIRKMDFIFCSNRVCELLEDLFKDYALI